MSKPNRFPGRNVPMYQGFPFTKLVDSQNVAKGDIVTATTSTGKAREYPVIQVLGRWNDATLVLCMSQGAAPQPTKADLEAENAQLKALLAQAGIGQ